MEDYSITIIQEEAVPLAAMPHSMISGTQWVIGVVAVVLVIGLLSYLIVCRSEQKRLQRLAMELGDELVTYCPFNLLGLRETRQELEYRVLEKEKQQT